MAKSSGKRVMRGKLPREGSAADRAQEKRLGLKEGSSKEEARDKLQAKRFGKKK